LSQTNVEIIEHGFVVWEQTGEPDWVTMHDEVEVRDHDIMDAGEYRGRAGIERWLVDWGSAWTEFSMDPEEFIDAGDRVVVLLRMRAKGRGSGIVVERQDAMVFQLRDGMTICVDYFNNREQGLAAAGLSG
jgi:ketosteroid isomerase-like protein